MDKNDGKKYRLVERMLNSASVDDIVDDSNNDIELGGLINYKDSDIIRSEYGNKIIDILGSL